MHNLRQIIYLVMISSIIHASISNEIDENDEPPRRFTNGHAGNQFQHAELAEKAYHARKSNRLHKNKPKATPESQEEYLLPEPNTPPPRAYAKPPTRRRRPNINSDAKPLSAPPLHHQSDEDIPASIILDNIVNSNRRVDSVYIDYDKPKKVIAIDSGENSEQATKRIDPNIKIALNEEALNKKTNTRQMATSATAHSYKHIDPTLLEDIKNDKEVKRIQSVLNNSETLKTENVGRRDVQNNLHRKLSTTISSNNIEISTLRTTNDQNDNKTLTDTSTPRNIRKYFADRRKGVAIRIATRLGANTPSDIIANMNKHRTIAITPKSTIHKSEINRRSDTDMSASSLENTIMKSGPDNTKRLFNKYRVKVRKNLKINVEQMVSNGNKRKRFTPTVNRNAQRVKTNSLFAQRMPSDKFMELYKNRMNKTNGVNSSL